LIFGEMPLEDAVGAVLAHGLVLGGRRLAKGAPVDGDMVDAARAAGVARLWVARPEPGDVPEAEAAAGVAALLAAAEAVVRRGSTPPLDVLLLFTISEEVGVGASHVLHGGDVAEMISVDNGTNAEGQNTSEFGVTVAMMDSAGPFDWHLTRHLLGLARENRIEHARDVFRYYRSDAASALEAGNDIRTALLCFACDASHGWERTHEDSLVALARLLAAQMLSPPLFQRDRAAIGPLADFPSADLQTTPDTPV
jgi:hypothetical protein